MSLPFQDRHDAGRQLAQRLHCYAGAGTIVVAVPRGGVPTGYEVAHALHAPLEIFLLRNLTTPDGECVGVVGSGGVRVLDHAILARLQLTAADVDGITQRERVSLVARERTYRGAQPAPDLAGRTVILVDDGLTPSIRLRDIVRAVSLHEPRVIVLALPVALDTDVPELRNAVDDLVLIVSATEAVPRERWYRELAPVSHTEVRALLALVEAEAQSRELART